MVYRIDSRESFKERSFFLYVYATKVKAEVKEEALFLHHKAFSVLFLAQDKPSLVT